MTMKIINLCFLISAISAAERDLGSSKATNYLNLEYGISMEPFGSYFSSYGYIYIPITFSIPTELPRFNISCGHVNINSLSKHHIATLKFIQSVVPKFSHSKRQKRWLPIVSGILGSGMAIWNRVSIRSLTEHVDVIQSNMEKIQSNIKGLTKTTNALVEKSQQIQHIVSDMIEAFSDVTHQLECTSENIVTMTLWEGSWSSMLVNSFLRAANAATQGKISPDLVSYANLLSLISSRKDLKGSIYSVNSALVYEIGAFLPIEIDPTIPIVSGIMILPKISRATSGELYSINTVPWIHKSVGYRLVLPNTAVISSSKVAWIPDTIECTSFPGLLICPKKFFVERQDICLTNIMQNNSIDACKVISKSGPIYPTAVQLQSGVLIGGATAGSISIIRAKKDISSHKISLSQRAEIFRESNGSYVMVNETIFQLSDLSHPYDFKEEYLYIPVFVSKNNETIFHAPDWIPIDKLQEPGSLIEMPSGHSALIYVLLFVLLILIIAVVIYLRYRTRQVIPKVHAILAPLTPKAESIM